MKTTVDVVISIYKEVKSIRKTAGITGYSKSGVEYLLKSNGVARFPRNRNGSENSNRKAILRLEPSDPRRLVRNSDYMKELYVAKKMSTPEIAKLLGLDISTVIIGLKQCGIARRTKSQALKGKSKPSAQGSKNHNWKGGLSGWRRLARGRLNEHFVRPVMERDNFTCQWCGSKNNIVVHHHKRSFMEIVNIAKSKCDISDIDGYVKIIVSEHKLDDGITICKKCHDKYHKENGK